jgi:hypothetical protein
VKHYDSKNQGFSSLSIAELTTVDWLGRGVCTIESIETYGDLAKYILSHLIVLCVILELVNPWFLLFYKGMGK